MLRKSVRASFSLKTGALLLVQREGELASRDLEVLEVGDKEGVGGTGAKGEDAAC